MPTVPDIHRRGTRAAQATTASPPLTVGTLYFVTDEGVTERWSGSAWEAYSGLSGTQTFTDITVSGQGLFADGTQVLPSIAFTSEPTLGFYKPVAGSVYVSDNKAFGLQLSTAIGLFLQPGAISMGPLVALGWSATTERGTLDTILLRDAAGVLALKNGTNLQTFRVYDTGGVSYAALSGAGLLVPDGTPAAPSLAFTNAPTTGFFRTGPGQVGFTSAGVLSMQFSGSGDLFLQSDGARLLFGATSDVRLTRDGAAGVLALQNGINPQKLSVYSSFTDAANYRRLELLGNFAGAQPGIYAAGLGSGVGGSLHLGADNNIFFASPLLPFADNTLNLGDPTLRVHQGYFGDAVIVGGSVFYGVGILALGGLTADFPRLLRAGPNIQFEVADGTALASLIALNGTFGGGLSASVFDAPSYKVGGVAGASKAAGPVTSITVVNGIVTAIS